LGECINNVSINTYLTGKTKIENIVLIIIHKNLHFLCKTAVDGEL
jgi:hypothetical protein